MVRTSPVMRTVPLLGGLLALSAIVSLEAQGDAKLWTGVFTPEQVARGKAAFEGECARCHNVALAGSDRGPALKGDNFWSHWEYESLNALFTKARDQMPPNLTGNQLEPQTKLDIITYVLSVNGVPTGAAELTTNPAELDGIQILRKGGKPGTPNFALVQAVGCLSQDANHAWILTQTSKPVTTVQPTASKSEPAAPERPLGDETFLLTSIGGFQPDTHKGDKVEVRGLIYKSSDENRIDLTSMQKLAAGCGN